MTNYRGFEKFLIGSQWAEPHGNVWHTVLDPSSGDEIGTVRLADEADIDAALKAARAALDSRVWTDTPFEERAEKIRAARAYCEGQIDRLVELSGNELGLLAAQNRGRHLAALTYFDDAIKCARPFEQTELRPDPLTGKTALVTREPVGIVVAIIPFNGPFAMGVNKTARALMAGCPVILKSSPEGSLHAEVLAEAYAAAGFPAGVVSVLPGGADAGIRLVNSPDIGMVTFTGSTTAGRAIAKSCAENFTRSSLELGGKSACIICDDADLDVVMGSLPIGAFGNSGQVCLTLSRTYVHRSLFDTVLERLTKAVEAFVIGDPREETTTLGPIVSRRQLDHIKGLVQRAIAGGARVVTGGSIIDRPGNFFEPTILTDVPNSAEIVQQEIFGPVNVILPFDDDDEAIRLANESNFGLHGAVFTRDFERGMGLVERVKTGTIALNGYSITATGPLGGVKWSGWGRENGPEGMEHFYELKSLSLDAAAAEQYKALNKQ
ncbi:aldehyde dehydrogenase family protein [Sphingomonas sp. MG17]|uniref:Aldehyde dehydrogenase family protein n=2 Tax=Sphingomonas tagetis TaxID=2949092 RepID=A0A9X2KMX1_9SPHN|nr:aldehyde dehydrogenase family protein [Sphingomonas tagetis]